MLLILVIIALAIILICRIIEEKDETGLVTTTTTTTSIPIKQDIISEDEIAKNMFVDLIDDAIKKSRKYNIIPENLVNDNFSHITDYKLINFNKYGEVNEENESREVCYDFTVNYLCDDSSESCWYRSQSLGEDADNNGYYKNVGSVTVNDSTQIISYSDYSCKLQYDSEI